MSYCGSMLRCVLQRATHLKNVERGERQSDPLASITFRGKMCMDLGGSVGNVSICKLVKEFSPFCMMGFSRFSGVLPTP